MICTTDGCGKPVDSKGLCSRCYSREYRRKRVAADPAYKAKLNAQASAWKSANPEKVRETKRKVRVKYKAEIAAYMAEYRKRNKPKARKQADKWRKENPEKRLAYKKAYRKRHHAKVVAKAKEWAAQNPEKRAQIEAKYRAANKDKTADRGRRWRAANLARHAARQKAREARKRLAMPSWANELDYQTVYETAARLTKETGVKHHVDHIVPLKGRLVSGLHVPWNLEAIPALDNFKKGNRFAG